MKKIKLVGTIISGFGTVALGIYLLMKLGFNKVILPKWGVILVDLVILVGSTIYSMVTVKELKESKNS